MFRVTIEATATTSRESYVVDDPDVIINKFQSENLERLRIIYPEPAFFVKTKGYSQEDTDCYDTEIEALNLLSESDLSPKVHAKGYVGRIFIDLISENQMADVMVFQFIAMTHCGKSLSDLYYSEEMADREYGVSLPKNWTELDLARVFKEPIPQSDREGVKKLIKEMNNCGVFHLDISPSNVVKSGDGKMRMIDFETCVIKK